MVNKYKSHLIIKTIAFASLLMCLGHSAVSQNLLNSQGGELEKSISRKVKEGMVSSRIIIESGMKLSYTTSMGDIPADDILSGSVNDIYVDTIYFYPTPTDNKRQLRISTKGYSSTTISLQYEPKKSYRYFVFDPNQRTEPTTIGLPYWAFTNQERVVVGVSDPELDLEDAKKQAIVRALYLWGLSFPNEMSQIITSQNTASEDGATVNDNFNSSTIIKYSNFSYSIVKETVLRSGEVVVALEATKSESSNNSLVATIDTECTTANNSSASVKSELTIEFYEGDNKLVTSILSEESKGRRTTQSFYNSIQTSKKAYEYENYGGMLFAKDNEELYRYNNDNGYVPLEEQFTAPQCDIIISNSIGDAWGRLLLDAPVNAPDDVEIQVQATMESKDGESISSSRSTAQTKVVPVFVHSIGIRDNTLMVKWKRHTK